MDSATIARLRVILGRTLNLIDRLDDNMCLSSFWATPEELQRILTWMRSAVRWADEIGSEEQQKRANRLAHHLTVRVRGFRAPKFRPSEFDFLMAEIPAVLTILDRESGVEESDLPVW